MTISTRVVVAKRTISATEIIGLEDLDYAQYDRNRLYNGYFQDPKALVGRVASQVILAGVVLTKKNVQQPVLIHRNQLIDLIAKSNTVTVTMKGVAKTDGRLNEAIQAYNPSSKRTLDAVVMDSNRAEIIS